MSMSELEVKYNEELRIYAMKANTIKAGANEILLGMMKLLSERSKEEPLPLQIETARVLAELAKAICW